MTVFIKNLSDLKWFCLLFYFIFSLLLRLDIHVNLDESISFTIDAFLWKRNWIRILFWANKFITEVGKYKQKLKDQYLAFQSIILCHVLLFSFSHSLSFHQHFQTHPDTSHPSQRINPYLRRNYRMCQFQFSIFTSIYVASHFLTRVPTNQWRVLLVSVLD